MVAQLKSLSGNLKYEGDEKKQKEQYQMIKQQLLVFIQYVAATKKDVSTSSLRPVPSPLVFLSEKDHSAGSRRKDRNLVFGGERIL